MNYVMISSKLFLFSAFHRNDSEVILILQSENDVLRNIEKKSIEDYSLNLLIGDR